jgi:N-acetylglucosaminyldiphosphoundecaprenol N-acetyl-beta-D-mannosaminyltransferase
MATQGLVLERSGPPVPDLAISAAVSPRERRRIELGGVLIDQIDVEGAVDRLREFLADGGTHQIVTVNLDFLSIAQRDPAFRRTLNAADLAVADGMPLVWASRLRGEPLPERVAGVDLVHQSCQLAARTGHSVFLLGAAPGVADSAARKLREEYPGLRVSGTYSPSIGAMTRAENAAIIRMIRDARPGFLFVALGAPRQDLWIHENRAELGVPVSIGVGCVFDLLAGSVERAPHWMQKSGLEWAHRLRSEPGRLWRRYLVNDTRMLGQLIFESASATRGEETLAAATLT